MSTWYRCMPATFCAASSGEEQPSASAYSSRVTPARIGLDELLPASQSRIMRAAVPALDSSLTWKLVREKRCITASGASTGASVTRDLGADLCWRAALCFAADTILGLDVEDVEPALPTWPGWQSAPAELTEIQTRTNSLKRFSRYFIVALLELDVVAVSSAKIS
ncbi:MAG: hypothetical protein HZA95_03635 [Candidatus Vogelbacteria bacterium]|nr:hypothetical protein [Candidatus Vogelbacteria bacterium]